MDDSEAVSLEQIRALLAGAEKHDCWKAAREVYAWVERTLMRHQYGGLGRADKGVVRQHISRMTGKSRAQVTRLIAGHRKTGRVKATAYQRTKLRRATRPPTWGCWPRGQGAANGASHSHRAGLDICASTPCIRAIRMHTKAFITSTRWTK